jgi:hypothetical protein
VERLLHETLALVDQNILHLIWVGLKREKKPPARLWLPSCILIPSCILFLHLLSPSSADILVLQVEVTWAHEAVLAAQEVATARDSTALRVKDVEDWAALVLREAWGRVSRMETESAMALTFAHEDAEGLVTKITRHEGELAERVGQGEFPWLV